MNATALLLCVACFGAACGVAAAQQPQTDPVRAKTSYESICAVCHGPAGEGGVGVPLKNITERLTLEQTIDKIKNPHPTMPKLYPAVLSEADVASIAEYIRTLK